MSALVLLPGEGKAVQIGGEGLGVVFKLFGTDTGGQFAVVEHPLAPGILGGPPPRSSQRGRGVLRTGRGNHSTSRRPADPSALL